MGVLGPEVMVPSMALRTCRGVAGSSFCFEALHGPFVRPLGMRAWAHEFVAQCLHWNKGLISLPERADQSRHQVDSQVLWLQSFKKQSESILTVV